MCSRHMQSSGTAAASPQNDFNLKSGVCNMHLVLPISKMLGTRVCTDVHHFISSGEVLVSVSVAKRPDCCRATYNRALGSRALQQHYYTIILFNMVIL